MRNIPLVDLQAQYLSIQEEIDESIARVIQRAAFILGEEGEAFEEAFATFCGTEHCVGVASGSAALHLALLGTGIGAGDEVITTPFTFAATAEAILQAGARPVFVDIDRATYNLDPSRLEAALTTRTRAIIPVHLYGQPAEMDSLQAVAKEHDLRVIGDAAQAHGAAYKGTPIGILGDAVCYSFYPSKNLGAYGDAGAVVTEDSDIARNVRRLRDHGRDQKHEHLEVGQGERLDELQAAILRVKLRHLDDWLEARERHARLYDKLLADSPVVCPYVAPEVRHVYHLYVIRTHQREALFTHLHEQHIGVGVHYPTPLHLQPAFARLGYAQGSFPEAEIAAREVLSLPMYAELEGPQIEGVAKALTEFFPPDT